MRARRPALLLAAAAVTTASACGGSHDSPDPPPSGYSGQFRLERYHTWLPDAPASPFLFAQVTFQGPAPGNVYLQGSPTLTIDGPGLDVPMIEIDAFGEILYQPNPEAPGLPTSDFTPDAAYSITNGGSHANGSVPAFRDEGAIRTPALLELLSPDVGPGQIDLDGTVPLPITWVPGDGSYLLVILSVSTNNAGQQLFYQVPDNGSFTIPTGGMLSLNPGIGSLTIERMIQGTAALPFGATAQTLGGDAISVRLILE